MSIIKRPQTKSEETAIDAFIAGAPDAKPVPAGKPAKVAISLQLPADLLAKVDAAAGALALSRAGYIKQALARSVQTGSN